MLIFAPAMRFPLRNHLWLLFLVAWPLQGSADFVWSDRCRQAFKAGSGLRFQECRRLLELERKENSANMVPLYIESHIDFIRAFIEETPAALESLKKNNALRIAAVRKDEANSPWKGFFLAEFYLQQAAARLKSEEYLGAATDIRKAFHLLEENKKRYPAFVPQLRGLGLLHAAAGAVPGSYQWALSLLGLNGTIGQGLGELRDCYSSTLSREEYSCFRDDILVLLTFLELNLDKEKRSYDTTILNRWKTIGDVSDKPLLLFARCIFHFSRAENDAALQLLDKRTRDPEVYPVNYFSYMEGVARLQHLDYTAEACFRKYISNHSGRSYIRSAWQRIAWVRYLQGDTAGYRKSLAMCVSRKIPPALTDEDKAAVKEAESGELPNATLLKARLLFDGGYYREAMAELGAESAAYYKRLRDKLELTYRLARIFDKQGIKDKAIYYYEATLRNGSNQKFYFAANSALLLGQLYEREGRFDKAIEYFRLTLNLPGHEYQNSIDQKARAGLNRLGVKT